MSSVQSFIRQIPLATTYYTCASGTQFYEFQAAPGNYVNNYPPGLMVARTTGGALPAGFILRDMGKTIKAAISGAPTAFNYYRQVQVLVPGSFTEPVGMPNTNTFGVIGAPAPAGVPSNFAPYYTLYVQTTVAGLGLNSGLTPIIGGQM